MAIGGVEVSEWIEHQSERIDLAVREIFHMRAIDLHPVTVAGIHGDGLAVRAFDGRRVVETVAGIEPAVEAAPEIARHAVRIFFEPEWPIENVLLIDTPVAIGVF